MRVLDDVVQRLLGDAIEHLFALQREWRLLAQIGIDREFVAGA